MIQVSSGYLHKFGPVFGPEHRTLVPAFILFTTIIILFKEMIRDRLFEQIVHQIFPRRLLYMSENQN